MSRKSPKTRKQFWNARKVLITGGNGFIGAWLTLALSRYGAKVVILVRENIKNPLFSPKELARVEVIKADITDFASLSGIFKRCKADTCFHLAGQPIVSIANESPFPTFESNIKGTWNVLESARQALVKRLIIASADKAYGDQKRLPYTEQMPLLAVHPYGASKICAELLSRTYLNTYGLPVAIVRSSNTYGGGDLNLTRIIPDTINAVLNNKNPVIRGNGSSLRDFVYIEDVIDAYLTLAESLYEKRVKGESFNLGSGRPISILEIAKKIIEISGRRGIFPIVLGKVNPENEISRQYLSNKKAGRILGWHPRYDLDEGLKLTINWYKDFYGIIFKI
ncbi:MAG: NAD-dependent epimerase/dehydratase family protein [Candidatus Omnitrophota bacterium]